MSFGFGVGDIIASGNLAIKTYALLDDSRGASSEYHNMKIMRRHIGGVIDLIQQEMLAVPKASPLPKPLVNALTVDLEECRKLLLKFDDLTRKYNAALSQGGSGKKLNDIARKLGWGTVRNDVQSIFDNLGRRITLIGTLYQLINAQSSRPVENGAKNSQVALQQRPLVAVSRNIDNWSDNEPIRFIDAFNRNIVLPYEFCATWESFHQQLRAGFHGSPEIAWVDSKRFEIFDESDKALIPEAKWREMILPGKLLSMAMLLRKQESASEDEGVRCPSCGDRYKSKEIANHERVRCIAPGCGTWFHASESRIGEVDDEEQPEGDLANVQGITSNRIRRWHVVIEGKTNVSLEERIPLPSFWRRIMEEEFRRLFRRNEILPSPKPN